MRQKLERKSLQDDATDWLRRAIILGEFAPGSVLTETALSDAIGVGRSTVRAALFMVEGEELVMRTPYSSWRVAPLDAQNIWEIYTLRAAFEGLAARILAERRATCGTELVDAAFAALSAADGEDTDARVAADLGFHASFVNQTGHGHLIRRHRSLAGKVEWLYRWSERHWPRRNPLVAEHEGLYLALTQAGPDAAEGAVRAHIDHSIQLDIAGAEQLARREAAG
ncbi:GntR family transcriptional regulator [Frigidibacter mobilis]|uniref:GntR family transcriptional regulator n=1 Tax=Frigidibacter mobilis TaxID=1335048 RepID=A0A159Z086_9RHOB|nr:GntR family transcriptional regulator [Frigidibacter mobilis]AMY67288.1 GntR family transcriptional regulator [Frigidibacter mobilis]